MIGSISALTYFTGFGILWVPLYSLGLFPLTLIVLLWLGGKMIETDLKFLEPVQVSFKYSAFLNGGLILMTAICQFIASLIISHHGFSLYTVFINLGLFVSFTVIFALTFGLLVVRIIQSKRT